MRTSGGWVIGVAFVALVPRGDAAVGDDVARAFARV